jgi:hypothetical protein
MGRRKIEIRAIKDDRNRSVTFLKRKGGLFKKAHELSVLCSVDVAVFVFGNNKKLYEYSSADMRDLIARYQFVSMTNAPERALDANMAGSMAAPTSTRDPPTLAAATTTKMRMRAMQARLKGMKASTLP